ncbi:hypothetical protein [Pseudonocardia yuanmonensis]|uniref:hypothetical protein n=1 Tax=Pseudonocardia yuanmonensis TaxID=1095914 RepID=UPI0031EF4360
MRPRADVGRSAAVDPAAHERSPPRAGAAARVQVCPYACTPAAAPLPSGPPMP